MFTGIFPMFLIISHPPVKLKKSKSINISTMLNSEYGLKFNHGFISPKR